MTKDLRSSKRRRTNNAAILMIGERQVPVLLRDVSGTGARIRLMAPRELPDRVHLVARMDKVDRECIVVWRRGKDCGLHFTAATAG